MTTPLQKAIEALKAEQSKDNTRSYNDMVKGFNAGLDAAIEIIHQHEAAQVDFIEAIKDGIAEARAAFAANPNDFSGSLDDEDLVSFIAAKMHRHLRTEQPKVDETKRESGDDLVERLVKALNRTRSHAYAMYQHYCEEKQGHIDNCNWWTQGTEVLEEIKARKS